MERGGRIAGRRMEGLEKTQAFRGTKKHRLRPSLVMRYRPATSVVESASGKSISSSTDDPMK